MGVTVVGIGEALFDIFPEAPGGAADAERLGGAPLNVAVHAHQLLAPRGAGVVVSRVGQDELGDRLIQALADRGMITEHIQTDPDHDTGKVYVGVDANGQPNYEIVTDTAWDVLSFDPDLDDLARRCEAVCFGSLAQRDSRARQSVYRFVEAARRAVRMFDVNLRQDFYTADNLRHSCEMANVVKLNADELPVLARSLYLGGDDDAQRVAKLIDEYDLRLVALTRGAEGTSLITADQTLTAEVPHYPAAEGADAVGAGDACAAAILVGLLQRWPLQRVVELANHLGAFVASQPGATPELPDEVRALAQ